MPRHGMNRSIRPVQSLKHVIDTNGGVSAALQSITNLAIVVDAPAPNSSPEQVNVGSKINSIYLRVEAVAIVAAGGVDNIYMAILKNPGNNLVVPNLDQVGTSDNRRYIIHQEMMMTGQAGGNPGSANIARTLFKGVIRLPRGYQRMGVNDRLQLLIQHRVGEATQQSNFCQQCIYKEYQ